MAESTVPFPTVPTSSKGSLVSGRPSTSTKLPAIPSITPVKVGVDLPKPPSTTLTKPLAVKPVKVKTKLAAIPSQDDLRSAIGSMPGSVANPYEEANTIVAANLNPLIQQLTQGYTQQGNAGANAIQQVTAEYARQLAGIAPQTAATYQGAEANDAASNAALEQIVQGGGTSDANALASSLAGIGSPTVTNPVAQQLTQQAQGAGGAIYGQGNAALEALIGSGAAQTAYAQTLPATARSAGLQELQQYLGALSGAESTDINSLTSKAPSLEQSAANTIIGQQEKAAANTSALQRAKVSASGALTRAQLVQAGDTKRAQLAQAGDAARNTASVDERRQAAAQTAATARWKGQVAIALDTAAGPDGTVSAAGAANLKRLGVDVPVGATAGTVGAAVQRAQQTAAHNAVTESQGQQRINVTAAHDQVVAAQAQAKIQIAQQNANTSAGRLALAQAKAAATTGKGSPLTSQETATLLKGWGTGTIKTVRVQATNAQGQPLTVPSGVNQGAPLMVDKTATTQQPVSYTDAIQGLVGLGKTKAAATAEVNASPYYQTQGPSTGRPYSGAAALQAATGYVTTHWQAGSSAAAALAGGLATGVIPAAALQAAIKKIYRGAKSAGPPLPFSRAVAP